MGIPQPHGAGVKSGGKFVCIQPFIAVSENQDDISANSPGNICGQVKVIVASDFGASCRSSGEM